MRHDYSLAHLTVLSLTPPQVIDVAARAGYRYVGLRMTRVTQDEVLYDLARDRTLMNETKARLAATGVAVLDTELFRMDPATEPERLRNIWRARRWHARASRRAKAHQACVHRGLWYRSRRQARRVHRHPYGRLKSETESCHRR